MAFFLSLNLVDIVVIGITLISGAMSTQRGFIREAMGLTGWVVSILIAQWTDALVLNLVEDSIESERLAAGVAWVIPFFFIATSWFVVANLTSPTLRHFTFGIFDRPMGFVFGLVRGFVVAVLIYIGMVLAADGERNLPRMVASAALIDEVRSAGVFLASLAPDSIRDTITDLIPRTHIDSDDVDEFNDRLVPDFDFVPGDGGDTSSGTLLPDELQQTPLIYDGQ